MQQNENSAPKQGKFNSLVGQTLTIEQEVAILDWSHDTILDQCETIEQARDLIVDETVRLMTETKTQQENIMNADIAYNSRVANEASLHKAKAPKAEPALTETNT